MKNIRSIELAEEAHSRQAGRWQVRVSGLRTVSSVKTLYSACNQAAVIEEVSCFLGVQASGLVKLPPLSDIVMGFDVEPSYWDSQYGFVQMDDHFAAGQPCCEDHK